MTHSAYHRAVDMFEALLNAPKNDIHETPASLIQAAGLPTTTGYRHVATLEAEGLLRRDENGAYLSGPSAIRLGLRAYGLGRLSPLVQPILLQLKQVSQHTSFLAVIQDMDLSMGPHSLGRETRGTRLLQRYSFDAIPDLTIGKVSPVGLRSFEDGMVRRMATLMVPIQETSAHVVVLGLALNPTRGPDDRLSDALLQAFRQFADAQYEVS